MGNIVKFGGAPVWIQGPVSFKVGVDCDLVIDGRGGVEKAPDLTQWIGAFSVLDGSGGLSIGEYTIISPGCKIFSHVNELPLKGADRPVVKRKTKIGSHVYLGPNVVVCAGVTIGDGAVIGAGTYIDEDVPEGMKVIPVQRKEYEYVGK